VALALVATLGQWVVLPGRAVAGPAPSRAGCPVERPDRAAALLTARWCGGRVEVAGEKSETTQVWAFPDGSLQEDVAVAPVRVRAGSGWVPVDLTLRPNGDGSVTPVAAAGDPRLSGATGAGTHVLAAMGGGSGRVSVGWTGFLPAPVLSGDTATYPEVLPGVDLLVRVTRTGLEQSFVVKDRSAAGRVAGLVLPVTAVGAASYRVDAAGNLTLVDAQGSAVARAAAAEMWDAHPVSASGDRPRRALVATTVAPRAARDGLPAGVDVRLAPDLGWMADPATVYPVTLDPTVNPVSTTFDTYVKEGDTIDRSGAGDLQIGLGSGVHARSFVDWDTSAFVGSRITSATVYLWNWYSISCTASSWDIWTTGAADGSTRWTAQPPWLYREASSTQTRGASSACDDAWVAIDGTSFFQRAADASASVAHMGIRATNESDTNSWKQFRSRNYVVTSVVPYASVTFNATATVSGQSTVPASQCATGSARPYLNSATPALRAQVVDPEGSPVTATLEWWVTGGSLIGSTTTGSQASGSTFSVTVPSGAFSNGGTYSWRVRGGDGAGTGLWSSWCEFTIDTTAPGAAPGVSSGTFPQGSWTGSPSGYSYTTATGTPYIDGITDSGVTGDDEIGYITFPFPVAFYGQTYPGGWIDTNGMIDLVDPATSHPMDAVALPNPAAPNATVYVFGEDLWADSSSAIRTATVGTAPNRRFVIEWDNVTRFVDMAARLNAEVVFNENGGDFTFNYTGLDNPGEQGGNALVGVENGDGTAATQYSYRSAVLADNTAITWHYNPGSAPVVAGTAAEFTFTAAAVSDVAAYQYDLDTTPPATTVNAPSLGASVTVSITPNTDGPHTLYVRSVDRAGNQSTITSYPFNVGYGGITSPKAGDITAGKVSLTAVASPAVFGVVYQWRRADTDAWQTIPESDVTVAAGGGPVTWPQAVSGGSFPKLNWDLAATVNNAEAGADPLDGPVQIRAAFGGGYSTPVKVTFDRNLASAASASIGPVSVNLLTGNASLTVTDVSVGSYGTDLTVARTFNSRQATATDRANTFGPGWVSGVLVDSADAPYTQLVVTGSLVDVDTPDGDSIGFTEKTVSSSGKVYESETGFVQLALTYTTSGDFYTLKDIDGNTVTFTRITGSPAGVYHPTAVTTPGSGQSTSVSWQTVTVGGVEVIRPTQVLAPVPAGVSCATLVRGCRALSFTYATATTATGTSPAQWGDYLGRLTQVSFTAWDPDASPAAMRTTTLARYSYDTNGRLRAQWDPRLDWTDTSTTPPTTRHLTETYDYDADGVLTTITPAGGFEPWQLSYTTIPGDPGKGRLAQVTRSALTAGTARTTIVYHVPLGGTGAPYDLTATQTSRWGQQEQPVEATAIFDAGQVPDGNQSTGTMPTSYTRARLTYFDTSGRSVNTVAPGGYTTAAWYDPYGNTVRTLSADNLTRALDASPSDTAAQEAAIAARESTLTTYSPDNLELWETLSPEHDTVLADNSLVRARTHTVNTYDQGAPPAGPYHLITTTTVTAQYTTAGGTVAEADPRTSTTGYDWNLLTPVVQTVDPTGLNLSTRTAYDPSTVLITSVTTPAGGTATNTPATTRTIYYRAGTGSGYTECDNHPEWANLTCRVQPGGQPATGPELPAQAVTYNMFNQPAVSTEKISTGNLRTTTVTYDTAGRAATITTVGAAGTGTAVPTQRAIYSPASGLLTNLQSIDASNNVTAQIIQQYDTLGRMTSYTDADGNVSTSTYDLLSQVATNSDGKATRTYTYDGGSERRGLPTQVVDSQLGSFTGTYDAAGTLTSQSWPNGITVTTGYDETAAPSTQTYVKTGCGLPDCTLHTEVVHRSAHDQQRDRTSTLSTQRYGYDNSGRLTWVNDTVNGSCATRNYTFSPSGNRNALTSYAPATDGQCQSTTSASSTTWTYDTADRVTTAGYSYDILGRTSAVPSADTTSGGESLTPTYHVNDLVRTLTQGTRTTTYTLDVDAQRIRSWTDSDGTTTTTRINHFSDASDSPSWTDESNGTWTRVVEGLAGMAAITTNTATTTTAWQIVNLHGDCVATVVDADIGLTTVDENTEYGPPRDPTQAGRRYGWLGSAQRAADTPSAVVLMGVRLYNPTTGRFLSVDPVYGGNNNPYTYPNDPINANDLDGRVSSWIVGSAVGILGNWLPNIICTASGFWRPVCTAVIGAAIGAIGYVAHRRLVEHKQIVWGDLAKAAVTGALAGLFNGFGGERVRAAAKWVVGKIMAVIRPKLQRLGLAAVISALGFIESVLNGVFDRHRHTTRRPPVSCPGASGGLRRYGI
jgi:RHS repeat-associated protein